MIPHHPRPELLQSPSELGWGSDLPLHTQNHPCPDTSGIMNPEPRPHPHLRPATHRQHFSWLIVLEGVCFLGFLLVCFCFTLVCYWDSVYFWLFFHISSYFSNTPVSFQIYFIFFYLCYCSPFLLFSIFLCAILCGMWDISSRARDWGWAPVVGVLSLKHQTNLRSQGILIGVRSPRDPRLNTETALINYFQTPVLETSGQKTCNIGTPSHPPRKKEKEMRREKKKQNKTKQKNREAR